MCGIAGVLHLDGEPAQPVFVQRMTDVLAHRGPDGEGVFTDGPVGLGHRRLAVIDLTPAGHQPMATPDGRYVLSYNGEVYNFHELRLALEAAGRRFRSRTDSEVVLHALAEWGLGALTRFNGMFELALWDRDARTLTLARDRYGTKPLYYTCAGDTVLFGSEVKAILACPTYRVDLDREALLEYFTFQNLFTDRTLFADVRMLPAGSYLTFRVGSPTPSPISFWDFDFTEHDTGTSDEEYEEELDRLFRQAVGRQLVADVPVASYLSGGLDSGSITAVASSQMREMKSFTVGFDLTSASGIELTFDERSAAEHLSYVFGTEHYEMVLKAGDLQRVLPRLTWHLEEPRVRQSYPNFYARGPGFQVRKGRSVGDRGRRALRWLPLALLPGASCRELRDVYRSVLRLLAAVDPEPPDARCLRSRLGRGQVRMDEGYLPRRVPRREVADRQLRRLDQSIHLPGGEDLPPWASGGG